MCKVCEGKEKVKGFDRNSLKVYIEVNKLKISYDAYSCDSSFDDSTSINYCFSCGKKLIK